MKNCFELKTGVFHPRCDHFVCIECFIRCYYGDGDESGKPTFPYPDEEEEYYDSRENPKWSNEMYPLIAVFKYKEDLWDMYQELRYTDEENLRKCPLCRK